MRMTIYSDTRTYSLTRFYQDNNMATGFEPLDKPHQPRSFNYPTRMFGKKNPMKRAFRGAWFEKWSWLHYNEASDVGFLCHKAEREGKLKAANKDLLYISKGYSNWKDATEVFRMHKKSKCHQDANQVMVILPVMTHDIGECCSIVHAQQKSENRSMLLKILQNIRFLSRQQRP